MKLLFDQNLSPFLVDRLEAIFPGSSHVMEEDLDQALDREIWSFASKNEYTIVTKDADFGELGLLRGSPPNVVWVRRGNCSTDEIESLLRQNVEAISELDTDPNLDIIELY